MPSVQLPGIQEFPQYEVVESPLATTGGGLYSDPSAMDTDYYPGGYDIESDFPPPPDDFPAHDDLPPPPPLPLLPTTDYGGEAYDTLRTPGAPRSPRSSPRVRHRPPLPQLYSLSQYLPQHHYPSDHPDSPLGGPSSNTLTSNTSNAATNNTTTAGGTGTGRSGVGRRVDGSYSGAFSMGYEPPALDNMSLSLYTSTASCSDMSACCEESEAMLSDYESGDDGAFDRLTLPTLDSQQHTEV